LRNIAAKKLVILGAGGMARETAWFVEDINRQHPEAGWDFIGFWQNDPLLVGTMMNGYPVLDPRTINGRGMYAVAAIGKPSIRLQAVEEANQKGFEFATLVHPSVIMDNQTVKIGKGSIICPGTVITTNVTIGDQVIVNVGCTVSHDCVLEDYATISPGCQLAGFTFVRREAFLGIGSVTIEHHEIGRNAVVGAGSVVINDIPENVTVVGVPARNKNGQ
jgi:sugar O-acyltransferase (sialic acid O-acetyltransferase NeuD family)